MNDVNWLRFVMVVCYFAGVASAAIFEAMQ